MGLRRALRAGRHLLPRSRQLRLHRLPLRHLGRCRRRTNCCGLCHLCLHGTLQLRCPCFGHLALRLLLLHVQKQSMV